MQIDAGVFDYAAEFPDSPRAIKTAAPQFFDVARQYLDSLAVRENTRIDYRRSLNRTWAALFDLPIDQIGFSDLQGCLITGKLHQKSAKYHNNELTPLLGVFKLAKKLRYITSNPAEELEFRKVAKVIPDPFTSDETESIISHIRRYHGEVWGDYFEAAFFTGMRNPSELIALPVENIDFEERIARVDRARARGRLELLTKTDEMREVYLNDRALAALRRTRARNGNQSGELFRHSSNGEPIITGKVMNDIWRTTLAVLNIRHRRMYNTRHTYATLMLEEGIEPAYAALQLGHSVRMFLEVYARWINNAKTVEQQQKINAAVGGRVAKSVAEVESKQRKLLN